MSVIQYATFKVRIAVEHAHAHDPKVLPGILLMDLPHSDKVKVLYNYLCQCSNRDHARSDILLHGLMQVYQRNGIRVSYLELQCLVFPSRHFQFKLKLYLHKSNWKYDGKSLLKVKSGQHDYKVDVTQVVEVEQAKDTFRVASTG